MTNFGPGARILVIPGCMLLLGGCTALTEPGGFEVDFAELDFRSVTSFEVSGSASEIQIRGPFGSGECHRSEVASATLRGDTIDFVFELRGRRAGDCPIGRGHRGPQTRGIASTTRPPS